MTKKGIKVDDLHEVLQDAKIVELLKTQFKEILAPTVEALFNGFVETFSSKLEGLVAKSAEALITKHCEKQAKQIAKLETDNVLLKARLDGAENQSRQDNLMIYGLTETANEPGPGNTQPSGHLQSPDHSTIQSVLNLCNIHLGMTVKDTDISYAYRVSSKSNIKHRPVVVRFVSRHIRNVVLSARKTLKNSTGMGTVFINEHLTKQNSLIFARARQLVKNKSLHSAWTRGGITFVRLSGDIGDKPKRIISVEDLENVMS